MSWVRLDDQFFHNRKARAVGPQGRELFVASWCYSAMQLNDGCFIAEDLPVIAALAQVPPDIAERLCHHELWHPAGHDCAKCRAVGQTMPVPAGHYVVHEYLKDNPTRAKVLGDREKDRLRKQSRSGTESGRNPAAPSRPPNTSLSSSGNSRDDPQPVDDDDLTAISSHDSLQAHQDERIIAPGETSQVSGVVSAEPDIATLVESVPDEVWVHYAELKFARQPTGSIQHPVRWKVRTRGNAKVELGEQAGRWWDMFRVTPRHLAECLVDGRPPRNAAPRRKEPA